MKICHITTVHPSRYDVRIFEKECTYLVSAGNEVTLIVNDSLPDENRNGVFITSLNSTPRGRIDRATRITGLALKKALEIDAEVYHLHDPELLRISGKLKSAGKKVIFDCHDFTAVQIMDKSYIPLFLRKPIAKYYRRYECRAINRLDGLVYPCTYAGKDYFADVHISKVLIGNLPSLESIRKISESVKDCDKTDKAVYVGDISEARGAVQMIKAVALAGRKLVLIGPIAPDLKVQIENMPEYECVEYKGVLRHDETMKEVGKCSVGLALIQYCGQYPYTDNLVTKIYEYMAMGLPQVISDFPYYKKQLEKYEFGIAVNPANEVEIATAINKIMENKSISERFISEGKRAVSEEYNWENDAKKLLAFYEKL